MGAPVRAGTPSWRGTLRGPGVPLLVAVNKADRPTTIRSPLSFTRLASASRSVSATHGLGTGDLLDGVVAALGDASRKAERGR